MENPSHGRLHLPGGGRVALGGVGGLFILPPNNDQEMEACYKMQRGSCSPGHRTGGRTVALAAAGTVARSLVPHLSWDAQATAGEAGGWSRARARRDPRSTSRRRSVESPILDHSFYKGSVPRFRPESQTLIESHQSVGLLHIGHLKFESHNNKYRDSTYYMPSSFKLQANVNPFYTHKGRCFFVVILIY